MPLDYILRRASTAPSKRVNHGGTGLPAQAGLKVNGTMRWLQLETDDAEP